MVQMAWHYHFHVFMMLHNDGSHRKKSAFPTYVVFMMKQGHSSAGQPLEQTTQKVAGAF